MFRKVNYEPSFWKEPVVEPPLKSIATEHATAVHNSTECDKIVVPHVKPRRVDVGDRISPRLTTLMTIQMEGYTRRLRNKTRRKSSKLKMLTQI